MKAALMQGRVTSSCGCPTGSTDSIRAEVLARLLDGEHMTNMDAVFGAGTTRLAAVIHVLCSEYGWTIDRQRLAVAAKDGHVAAVTRYSLSRETINAALAEGASEWQRTVFAARRARRANASKAGDKVAQRSRCLPGAMGKFSVP